MLCECVRHSSWKEIGMPDLPPNRSTASTASVAKWSFSCCNLGEAAGPMQRTEKSAGSLKMSLDDYDLTHDYDDSVILYMDLSASSQSKNLCSNPYDPYDPYDPRASISPASSAKSHGFTRHEPHLHVQRWHP